MQAFAEHLRTRLEHGQDELLALAHQVITVVPEMGPGHYSEDEIRQLLNGFRALMSEALEERGSEVFDFYVETAVPALIAEGQSVASLAGATATYAVLVSVHLADAVPADHRTAAQVWLAEFFGRYMRAIVTNARAAEQDG